MATGGVRLKDGKRYITVSPHTLERGDQVVVKANGIGWLRGEFLGVSDFLDASEGSEEKPVFRTLVEALSFYGFKTLKELEEHRKNMYVIPKELSIVLRTETKYENKPLGWTWRVYYQNRRWRMGLGASQVSFAREDQSNDK